MIKLEHITKSFGTLNVLKDISMEIRQSEIVSIVGPSGAGKTTLLQIMGLLDRPDSGNVTYGEINTTRMSENESSVFRNRHIGFVFQFHQLLPEFTAKENIMIPCLIGGLSKRDSSARADELLSTMGMSTRSEHKPSQLSGGENQRIAVARALANNPDIILADEPSGSLDTQNRKQLYELFFNLRESLGQTFVIITHDESLSALADRTIRLCDGRITEQ